jgi:hypothetical protein
MGAHKEIQIRRANLDVAPGLSRVFRFHDISDDFKQHSDSQERPGRISGEGASYRLETQSATYCSPEL